MPNFLDVRHPDHTRTLPYVQFYTDHYLGGISYPAKTNPLATLVPTHVSMAYGASRYLIQNPLELVDHYLMRLARAAVINVTAPIVDFYCGVIGKPGNISITSDAEFAEFIDDADLAGHSLTQFMAGVRTAAMVRGVTFVLVDSTRATEPVVTEADARRQGIRPYVVHILPENLLNWKLDRFGRPIEILFRVPAPDTGSVLDTAESDGDEWEYRYWSAAKWQVYRSQDNAPQLIEEGEHGLGFVPLVPVYFKQDRPFTGISLLKDSAKLQHLAFNWLSSLDQTFVNSCFPQPVITTNRKLSEVGLGTSAVIKLNPDKENAESFEWVSPDVGPFSAGWEGLAKLVILANRSMGMTFGITLQDGADAPESGVSKSYDFVQMSKVLDTAAENEQEAVKSILHFAALWMGYGQGFTGSVQYTPSIDLNTLTDDIANIVQIQATSIPPTAQRELMRTLINKMLPSLPPEAKKQIDSELEKLGVASARIGLGN